MKKALKIVAILIVVLCAWVFLSIQWTKKINEQKWERFAGLQHCKLISGAQYQCDMGKVTKPIGD